MEDPVRTKNAKAIKSTFFPVGADIETIVSDWVRLLRDGGAAPAG